jgi:hypothetical protein
VSILNVYAPTEDKEDSVKDNFYERLEREYDAIPSNDIKNDSRRLECKGQSRRDL